MTFETCPYCGQHHPSGMTSHRTLEGEWCMPAEPMSVEDLERVRARNATSFNISWRDARWVIATAIKLREQNNEYHACADASGQTKLMAWSVEMERQRDEAVERAEKAERERDELRELLSSGAGYVRDATHAVLVREDGADEWLERVAVTLSDKGSS